jgi:hypothetical protein
MSDGQAARQPLPLCLASRERQSLSIRLNDIKVAVDWVLGHARHLKPLAHRGIAQRRTERNRKSRKPLRSL